MLMDRGALDRSGLDREGGIAPVAELAGYAYTDTAGYGHILQDMLLRGYAESETSGYGRLRIDHDLSGYAESETSAYGQARIYHEVSFAFTGTLAAGKTIIIDGEKYTVLNDGVNAIADFSGDFPEVFPGTTLLTYEDTGVGRDITITVVKQDRRA